MTLTLHEAMLAAGAAFKDETVEPVHFGQPAAELDAALRRTALADGSQLGRLLGSGPDLPDLLQRLGTGDLRDLRPGDGRATVLTSPKGRIVSRVFVHSLGDAGLLLRVGPGSARRLLEHLARFTFRERTDLSDIGDTTRQLILVGPGAAEVLRSADLPVPEPFGAIASSGADAPLTRVLGGDGVSAQGFSLVVPRDAATTWWDRLLEAVRRAGGRPAGSEALEARRILLGLPLEGRELTEEVNPLEAGLRTDVSFDKGCYVGQEVIARLNTYEKVSRVLLGLEFPAGAEAPSPGAVVTGDGNAVGRVTSATLLPGRDHAIALAFVKRKALRPTLHVVADHGAAVEVRCVELPFKT